MLATYERYGGPPSSCSRASSGPLQGTPKLPVIGRLRQVTRAVPAAKTCFKEAPKATGGSVRAFGAEIWKYEESSNNFASYFRTSDANLKRNPIQDTLDCTNFMLSCQLPQHLVGVLKACRTPRGSCGASAGSLASKPLLARRMRGNKTKEGPLDLHSIYPTCIYVYKYICVCIYTYIFVYMYASSVFWLYYTMLYILGAISYMLCSAFCLCSILLSTSIPTSISTVCIYI